MQKTVSSVLVPRSAYPCHVNGLVCSRAADFGQHGDSDTIPAVLVRVSMVAQVGIDHPSDACCSTPWSSQSTPGSNLTLVCAITSQIQKCCPIAHQHGIQIEVSLYSLHFGFAKQNSAIDSHCNLLWLVASAWSNCRMHDWNLM